MLLTVASLLTGFGFAAWIAGSLFDATSLAFVGAAIIIGAGGWVMITGLEVEAGTVETNVSENVTETESVYEPVESPFSNFSVGAMVLLLGGVAGMYALEDNG